MLVDEFLHTVKTASMGIFNPILRENDLPESRLCRLHSFK
jgi:hypothetical protein